MGISKITIRNYRGIEAREIEVGQRGFVAHGRNGAGKTSILSAVRSALAAQDIAPDAIRHGADKAEILIDVNDVTVRRVITAKTSSVVVKQGGFKAEKPTAFLAELLGTSPLDPLDLFLAKPKEQRAQVLAALPVQVTEAQLLQWAPKLPPGFSAEGHGLEVVARLHKAYYDIRTDANREAADARREADKAHTDASITVSGPGEGVSVASAEAELTAARADAAALSYRHEAALASQARTAKVRERIAEIQAAAAEHRSRALMRTPDADLAEARLAANDFMLKVRQLEAALQDARDKLRDAQARVDDLALVNKHADAAGAEEARLVAQATELEATLAGMTPAAVTAAEVEAITARVHTAQGTVDSARRVETRDKLKAAAEVAGARAAALETKARELDGVVRALANDAPAALLANAAAIPGLTLAGDDIFLDGVKLSGLCGQEQLVFAVEIARRANAKSKILVCDGLERLDPDQYDRFVREATRGGYQLLGTRVDRGEVVCVAISDDDESAAAQ